MMPFEQDLRQFGTVEFQTRERTETGNLPTTDAVHGEHTFRAVIGHRLRYLDAFKLLEILPHGDEVLCLTFIVQLILDGGPKFLQHGDKAIAATGIGVRIEKAGDVRKHFKILRDLWANVGSLNFDHHGAAIA